MKLFFLLFFAAYVGGNIYIFVRLMQLLSGMSWPLKTIVAVLFWVVAFAMVIALFARNAGLPDVVMRMLYQVGSVWMVFTLYMVLALLVFDVAKIFIPSMRFGLLYAAGITISLLVFGYWNYRHPKVEHIDIELDKPVKEALTIVAVSDVHLGDGTDKKALTRYVKMINEQQPDLILIGGDLIDNSLKPVREQRMEEELNELKAPLGIYMVMGNHEYISGAEECKEFFSFLHKNPEVRPVLMVEAMREHIVSNFAPEDVILDLWKGLGKFNRIIAIDVGLVKNRQRLKRSIPLMGDTSGYTFQFRSVPMANKEACLTVIETILAMYCEKHEGIEPAVVYNTLRRLRFPTLDIFTVRLVATELSQGLSANDISLVDMYERLALNELKGDEDKMLVVAHELYEYVFNAMHNV